METNLSTVFQHFVTNSKYIKELFRATTRNFSDLQVFDPTLSQVTTFSIEDQRSILSLVCGSPALVVLGQNVVKAQVVNRILNEPLLLDPMLDNEVWRMVKIKFSKNRFMTHLTKEGYDVSMMTSKSHEGLFRKIPREELMITQKTNQNLPQDVYLQVGLKSHLLRTGLELVIAPTSINELSIEQFLVQCRNDYHALAIYCLDGKRALNQLELYELQYIKNNLPSMPLLFVCSCESPESEYANQQPQEPPFFNHIHAQLCEMGLLNTDKTLENPQPHSDYHPKFLRKLSKEDDFLASGAKPENDRNGSLNDSDEKLDATPLNLYNFVPYNQILGNLIEFSAAIYEFCRSNILQQLVLSAYVLNDAHTKCLDSLIVSAHDMQRDVQITPKRLQFAKDKEDALFQQLLDISTTRHRKIRETVERVITTESQDIVQTAGVLEFQDVLLPPDGFVNDVKVIRSCIIQLQDHVFNQLNKIVSEQLLKSVSLLRESVLGTVTRCLETLENSSDHESYAASQAFKSILDSAYHLDVTARSSSSAMKLFMDRIRMSVDGFRYTSVKIDESWKEKIGAQLISSVTPSKLAKSISQQFHQKLVASHKAFAESLRNLEAQQQDRLQQKEGARDQVRKVLTPKIARLSLQSIALKDQLDNGMPDCRREIGRGQYGIVYSCNMWGGEGPLAVKSVVPPDEKHWNDLALEFHYTWSLPTHPRIVPLIGVVIDKNYTNNNAAVLLMMPRLPKDLYIGLKEGLSYRDRVIIALDVAEGIRFLHNQGLLHRDIKLKNILVSYHYHVIYPQVRFP
ncbi:Dual serine/threonine and tyrosine protein kinase-like [Oopsacas minuta]|uniref:Dual serine/threonine and tyrosine protein kinase n=1 Tax=Oopsacas minuta TaxID=111878 RepID=A0AAV7JC41_9METZ|nr:Dual serine/threonine and tyrosine protein kinase-like [Oopsacas minuta]